MKQTTLLMIGLIFCSQLVSMTLKEAYEAASAANGYDKFIELETGVTYTGGLIIGKVLSGTEPFTLLGEEAGSVFIKGNGAILDLQGEQISISYIDERLDIEDCIIINGNVRFNGDPVFEGQNPQGSVRYVTFYQPHDYGIRLYGTGEGIDLERNIVVDVVDTGFDFSVFLGNSMEWLPTGTSFALSVQVGFFGIPNPYDNWSFHSDVRLNEMQMTHFSML